ncbi:MAG TPA: cupin domain-containing protein [Gammaproteobacteria bacterium]|nr:cupin domain-containing protein [Gammaproteobacteria bacterium]
MRHITIKRALAAGIAALILAFVPPVQSQVDVERTILLQQDLAIPGYEVVLVAVTIAVGGREGRHSHPGTLVGRVLEGELTLELEGQPTRTLKAGDSVLIEPGQVHEGINKGGVPMKALVTFIVQKGKPLRIPAA